MTQFEDVAGSAHQHCLRTQWSHHNVVTTSRTTTIKSNTKRAVLGTGIHISGEPDLNINQQGILLTSYSTLSHRHPIHDPRPSVVQKTVQGCRETLKL
ncbi:hypothetical protein L3Y34_008822 [Caenorhabditis briggsae]|uniref:Uncharacterized protein n=1 Tax=Caenorhabditis briggsae TaxID=6238 RepID=A0AAE9D1N9_CAEBR|nr:hypothetical protein L3Y34_008822 [Caenorhabditis briggsae]